MSNVYSSAKLNKQKSSVVTSLKQRRKQCSNFAAIILV